MLVILLLAIYNDRVTITYNPPASGSLSVNGQTFAITSSPQTVTLTGLTSNGSAVNVTANFTANTACTYTENSLFTAPAPCNVCSQYRFNCWHTRCL
ncbi:MAG: hypothetical protein R2777_04375 [Chitinophagales bacterium]